MRSELPNESLRSELFGESGLERGERGERGESDFLSQSFQGAVQSNYG